MSLCTWGLPSQTTCPSTVNSIKELEWLPRNCPGSQHVYGPTTSFQIIPKSMYIISSPLYGCESWTMHAHQEKRLNVFHMRCLRRILGITWQDRMTNKVVLEKAGIPSLYTLLKQRRMRWLGHVTRMEDGRIPKDLLYGKLATGKRPTGRPLLHFKDI